MAASAAAEAAVKKLARLPGNTICPNCGTQKKFGFSTVCIKYLTFVCNNCKSGHQAISHRCKSLTMSSWTDGEVLQLKTHGNDHCRNTWLAKAPPPGSGGRPREGDHIALFKSFIVDAYERKKYYGEGSSEDGRSSNQHMSHAPPAPATVSSSRPPPPSFPPAPAPPPASAPAVDLLSFESSAPAPSQPSVSSDNVFDPFNQTNTDNSFPLSSNSFSANNETTSGPKNNIALQPPQTTAPTPNNNDPFGFASFSSQNMNHNTATPTPAAALPTKKPIMGGASSGSNYASGTGNMNAFDSLSAPQQMSSSRQGMSQQMFMMQQQRMRMMQQQQMMMNHGNAMNPGAFQQGNMMMGSNGVGGFNNMNMMGASGNTASFGMNNNNTMMGNNQGSFSTSSPVMSSTSHTNKISHSFGQQQEKPKKDPFSDLF